jgi:capsular exopolysaccharide synthesis family protein
MEEILLRNTKELSYAKKESLRTLKTNIQFCGDDVKVIMLTSSVPNEGKSTLTFNLAQSITDSGKSVLIIDTDMRGSVMMGQLHAKSEEGKKIVGLSHYLSGQKTMDEVMYRTQIPNLHIIFSGPSAPNPTEMLEKNYYEQLIEYARKNFDYVLIDCAPLGAVIDAAVVAKHCDGAVIVIAQGMVGSRVIATAKEQLAASGVRILGVVLNKVKSKKHRYGRFYGKYYGSYYGKYYGYGSYGGVYGAPYGEEATDQKKGKDK